MRSLKRNAPSSQKWRCPNGFAEKQPKLGKNGTFFTENGGASRFLSKNVVKPIHPLDPTQNYNSTLAFLKIPPSGRKRGPFPRDLAAKSPKKGGTVTKKGAKKSPHKKWLPLSDAKFDVDYDSAIKHDLIL